MFHSDLVYLRENVKALKEILKVEKNFTRASRRVTQRVSLTSSKAAAMSAAHSLKER